MDKLHKQLHALGYNSPTGIELERKELCSHNQLNKEYKKTHLKTRYIQEGRVEDWRKDHCMKSQQGKEYNLQHRFQSTFQSCMQKVIKNGLSIHSLLGR